MCDKEAYAELRDRVTALEKGAVRFDEQIKTLFNSVVETEWWSLV